MPVADQITLQNVVVRKPPHLLILYQKTLAALKLNNECGTPIPVDARPYIEAVLLHEDRRISVTANGYVGLGSDWIEIMRQGRCVLWVQCTICSPSSIEFNIHRGWRDVRSWNYRRKINEPEPRD